MVDVQNLTVPKFLARPSNTGDGFLALGTGSATVASILFFGWLLVMASCIEIAQAVIIGHWAGLFYHLVAAILFGVAGLLFVTSSQA